MFQVLGKSLIDLNINGEMRNVAARPSDNLLYIIREQLGLTGTKNGCENGDCGTCTVLFDDIPVKSCLILAVEAVGHRITTIEGLKDVPVQKAFIENGAFQCGYCTPGLIVNSHALATNFPDADDKTIEVWLQSNICRCTGYKEIKDAVKSVLNSKKL